MTSSFSLKHSFLKKHLLLEEVCCLAKLLDKVLLENFSPQPKSERTPVISYYCSFRLGTPRLSLAGQGSERVEKILKVYLSKVKKL